jgi:hypothetical protein
VVQLLSVATDEEIVADEDRHPQETVVMDQEAEPLGIRQRVAGSVEANDVLAHLDQEPARASRQRERSRLIDAMRIDGSALEDDATPREILPRFGGCRSVVLVVEDGRHVASFSGDFSEVNCLSTRRKTAERPEGAGQAQDDPRSAQWSPYLPAMRFFFTYAQIFFVISEGPMGLGPMTDSSVSVQPLKLIA